ncbi:MAG: hypothetical protein JWP52_4540 [Rhizobacter sp.]|nr:hypothetical protein [Rhizobacter sp.]
MRAGFRWAALDTGFFDFPADSDAMNASPTTTRKSPLYTQDFPDVQPSQPPRAFDSNANPSNIDQRINTAIGGTLEKIDDYQYAVRAGNRNWANPTCQPKAVLSDLQSAFKSLSRQQRLPAAADVLLDRLEGLQRKSAPGAGMSHEQIAAEMQVILNTYRVHSIFFPPTPAVHQPLGGPASLKRRNSDDGGRPGEPSWIRRPDASPTRFVQVPTPCILRVPPTHTAPPATADNGASLHKPLNSQGPGGISPQVEAAVPLATPRFAGSFVHGSPNLTPGTHIFTVPGLPGQYEFTAPPPPARRPRNNHEVKSIREEHTQLVVAFNMGLPVDILSPIIQQNYGSYGPFFGLEKLYQIKRAIKEGKIIPPVAAKTQ